MPPVEGEARKKKLALVGHCALNQNARAPGIAIHKGAILPLFRLLANQGWETVQLPCPETSFTGVRRWWFVYELYDSVNYRRHCARLARAVARIVRPYSERGCDIAVVGLGLSPSCGVRMRLSSKVWRGKPFDVGDEVPVAAGEGVWMQELEAELVRNGIAFRILDIPPVLIYPRERVPKVAAYPPGKGDAWRELEEFLGA